ADRLRRLPRRREGRPVAPRRRLGLEADRLGRAQDIDRAGHRKAHGEVTTGRLWAASRARPFGGRARYAVLGSASLRLRAARPRPRLVAGIAPKKPGASAPRRRRKNDSARLRVGSLRRYSSRSVSSRRVGGWFGVFRSVAVGSPGPVGSGGSSESFSPASRSAPPGRADASDELEGADVPRAAGARSA